MTLFSTTNNKPYINARRPRPVRGQRRRGILHHNLEPSQRPCGQRGFQRLWPPRGESEWHSALAKTNGASNDKLNHHEGLFVYKPEAKSCLDL